MYMYLNLQSACCHSNLYMYVIISHTHDLHSVFSGHFARGAGSGERQNFALQVSILVLCPRCFDLCVHQKPPPIMINYWIEYYIIWWSSLSTSVSGFLAPINRFCSSDRWYFSTDNEGSTSGACLFSTWLLPVGSSINYNKDTCMYNV